MNATRIAKWIGISMALFAVLVAGAAWKLASESDEDPDESPDPPDFYASDMTLLDGGGEYTVQEKMRLDAGPDWPLDPCGARYLIRFEDGRYVWGETSAVTCATPVFHMTRPQSYQIYWLSDAWGEWEAQHSDAGAAP